MFAHGQRRALDKRAVRPSVSFQVEEDQVKNGLFIYLFLSARGRKCALVAPRAAEAARAARWRRRTK